MKKAEGNKSSRLTYKHHNKYIKNMYDNLSLQKRIMILFSLLIFIALSIIGIISYTLFSSYTQDMLIKQKLKIGKSVIEEISTKKERDAKISDQLLINKYIQANLINTKFNDAYDRLQRLKLVNSVLYSMVDSNSVVSIYIAGNNGMQYKSNPDDMISISKNTKWEDSVIYKEAIKGGGKNVWIPMVGNIFQVMPDKTANVPYIYIVRKMKYLENIRKEIGISIVQLNYYRLYNTLSRMATGDNEYSILVASNGTIISHTSETSQIGSKLNADIMGKTHDGNEGYFFIDNNKGKELVLYNKYQNLEWFIIQVIPYVNITERSKEIRNFTVIIMLIGLSISMIISVAISKNITNPIISLKDVMDQFGKGKLMVRANINRNDEIGKLEESFNQMAEEIKSLMNRIEDEHKRSRKLELNIIEYQINPHFLYNTLDSINWMAQKSGQKDIGEMVTTLAKFFRIGLSKGQDFIKLKDELEHARSYLIICKIRYRDCFSYEINIDEKILNYKTIKIVLQPLIENAIKHGIYKDSTEGIIQINGRMDQDFIILEVKDNGKGIEYNQLKWLQSGFETGRDDNTIDIGFGLFNVNERIKLNFGAQYGVEIYSRINEGTTVTIKMPIIK